MLKIDVICISKIKNNAFADLIDMYKKRIKWSLNIIDLESKYTNPVRCKTDESQKILKYINKQAIVITLDEKGNPCSSLDLSKKLQQYAYDGRNHIQFIIGGADGLTQEIHQKSDLILSFGLQTWPHALARVMLLEQIYRSQQIISAHPYHRE